MQDDDGKKCREMIAAIARGVAETQHFIGRDRLDPRVTDALMAVPRHEFVPADLRGRGFKFVGATICYAFMQATGMVNDHLVACFRHTELRA